MAIHVFYHFMSGQLIPKSLGLLYNDLAYNKQLKISHLRNTTDKYRSLCGLYLWQYGMRELGILDASVANIVFKQGCKPKSPFTIDFSISHAHNLIICVLSKNLKVGVDIESLTHYPIAKKDDIAQTQIETTTKRTQEKLSAWTRKEAIIKAHGNSSLAQIETVQLHINTGRYDNLVWYLQSLALHTNYIVHVASNGKNAATHINQISDL